MRCCWNRFLNGLTFGLHEMMLEQILSVLSTVHSVLQLSEVTIILMRYSGSATKFEVSLTVSVT